MGFGGADSPFYNIAAVDIWWDELVFHFLVFFYYLFVFCADLIVENLNINNMATIG